MPVILVSLCSLNRAVPTLTESKYATTPSLAPSPPRALRIPHASLGYTPGATTGNPSCSAAAINRLSYATKASNPARTRSADAR